MNKKNKIFPPNKHLGAKIQVKANKTGEGKEDEGENSTRRELEENKHCNKYLGTQVTGETKCNKTNQINSGQNYFIHCKITKIITVCAVLLV